MWDFIEDGPGSRWQCTLLSDWPHGFFTRRAPQHNPALLARVLGLDGPAFSLKQVHSSRVLAAPVPPATQGDGLWTRQASTSAWVCTADCVPILLADRQRRSVAAIHAGWRGTAQRILAEAVASLVADGSKPSDLICVLGPAISGSAYQVGHDVATEVTATIPHPEHALLTDPQPDRVRLDVRAVNLQQAIALGIPASQVAICPVCTYGEENLLFSYRREGAGRVQYSGIGCV